MAELPQVQLLDRIRAHAEASADVVGLIVLGSFATGTADLYSDLDLGLYVADEALPTFDLRAWLEAIAPVTAISASEDASTVLFRSLIRAEIHVGAPAKADDWATLTGLVSYPGLERILLFDRGGALADRIRPLLAPLRSRSKSDGVPEFLALVDALLVADACRRRGALARALTHLASAHTPLLRLARLAARATDEWVAPDRRLESDLPERAYERYRKCTASLDDRQLHHAISAAWRWGLELAGAAADVPLDSDTIGALDRRLSAVLRPELSRSNSEDRSHHRGVRSSRVGASAANAE